MRRRQFMGSLGGATLLSGGRLGFAATPGGRVYGTPAETADTQDPSREFFYRPAGAWAADFIPFYKDGTFHLFYLLDWRDRHKHGEGTPWYQISTRDFVHFTEHGEMLARGTAEEQDLYVFTGSVIEGEGRFHIFYTGHNSYFRRQGKPEQGIDARRERRPAALAKDSRRHVLCAAGYL